MLLHLIRESVWCARTTKQQKWRKSSTFDGWSTRKTFASTAIFSSFAITQTLIIWKHHKHFDLWFFRWFRLFSVRSGVDSAVFSSAVWQFQSSVCQTAIRFHLVSGCVCVWGEGGGVLRDIKCKCCVLVVRCGLINCNYHSRQTSHVKWTHCTIHLSSMA